MIDNHDANIEILKCYLRKENISGRVHPKIKNLKNADRIWADRYIFISKKIDCSHPRNKVSQPSFEGEVFEGKVIYRGSSTVAPIMIKAGRDFEKHIADVGEKFIEPMVTGSRDGLEEIQTQVPTFDIAGISDFSLYENLNDNEKENLEYLLLGYDSVTFVVQPDLFINQPSIDMDGLKYLLTKAEKWDDKEELKSLTGLEIKNEIDVCRLYPTEKSGTLSFVADTLKIPPTWIIDKAKIKRQEQKCKGLDGNNYGPSPCVVGDAFQSNSTEDDTCLVEGVIGKNRARKHIKYPAWRTPNFGFVGYSYAKSLKEGSILKIQSNNKILSPGEQGYPFKRKLGILIRKDVKDNKKAKCTFLKYLFNNAKSFVEGVGYQALPDYEEQMNKLKEYCN
jgi:ABC-type phosphate transport system substrate-binding protein